MTRRSEPPTVEIHVFGFYCQSALRLRVLVNLFFSSRLVAAVALAPSELDGVTRRGKRGWHATASSAWDRLVIADSPNAVSLMPWQGLWSFPTSPDAS